MAFYKFIDGKDVEKFCSGSMLFRNLHYYRNLDEKDGRGDRNEGKIVSDSFVTPSGLPIKFELVTKRRNDWIMCMGKNVQKQNAEQMRCMGDAVIIIKDENAFIGKVEGAARSAGYEIICKDAEYYEDDLPIEVMDEIVKGLEYFNFMKQKKLFEYQQEFRFMIYKSDDEDDNEVNKVLDIGDIRTLVEVLKVEELLERLT